MDTQDPTAPGTSARAGSSGPTASTSDRYRPDDMTDDHAPAEALKHLGARISELGEYISYYLSAKVDGIKVTFRNLGIMAALGVVGLLAAGGFIVTLMVMLLRGIAGAIGAIFNPDRMWAGELITSILFLGLLAAGVIIGMKKLTKGSRERTAKKYAARQQQERSKFGTDVRQRAQDPAE